MSRWWVVVLVMGLLPGCRREKRHVAPLATVVVRVPKPEPRSDPQPDPQPQATPALELLSIAAADVPPIAMPKGTFVSAFTWHDAAGKNLALFTRIDIPAENTELLRVDHYVHAPSASHGLVHLRTIRDGIEKCDGDGGADFRDKALGLTDLDGDGRGELTFAYRIICVTDVSPGNVKLIVIESGDKFILRGVERMKDFDNGPSFGGEFTVDPGFDQAPPGFLDHAKATWERIIDRESI